MPTTFEELATMLAKRDDLSFEEELAAIRDTAAEMEFAFMDGNLNEAEDILRVNLGLEPDYLDIFIM